MNWTRSDKLVGGVELGGTHVKCAVGHGSRENILSRAEFPTGDRPAELLDQVVGWLRQEEAKQGRLHAIGIASFGPVVLSRASPWYGFITNTPKTPWVDTDVLGPFKRAFKNLPIGFNTDVNGAALGEYFWGEAAGLDDFVYITMGTGIGGGGMSGGVLLGGMVHPEMGHVLLPPIDGDPFEGSCDFHRGCWEGRCSGSAIEKKTNCPAGKLAVKEEWELVAQYTALALADIIFILSPRKIIIGGSVRKAGKLGQDAFFGLIRKHVRRRLNGYVKAGQLTEEGINDYIVPPLLEDDAGLCGAIALAQCALAGSVPNEE